MKKAFVEAMIHSRMREVTANLPRMSLVASILLIALVLRLNDIYFGLPSLYDPDEPLFVVKAAGLLTHHTLNPHWFGHPGSTTIYLTAVVQAIVYIEGFITGRFTTISGFVGAAYADPTIIFGPARIAMAILGTICVGLTYLLGKTLFNRPVGLLASLLLSLNSLHIAWSQVIRSDIQSSDFMLAVLLVACRLGETGRLKYVIWSGLLTGFAVATKWPAVTAFVGVIGAVIYAATREGVKWAAVGSRLATAGAAAIVGLFIASPFIFFDYRTVIANLGGEDRPFHVGHTGHGFLSNLFTYLGGFTVESMGWIGLLLAIFGAVVTSLRPTQARYILLPASIAFFISISAPHLVWSRWLLPGLPYLAIFASAAVFQLGKSVTGGSKRARSLVTGALAAAALFVSAWGAVGEARERQNDTRTEAARWIVAHVPSGSTIVLEHLELSLRNRPYRFLFPMGQRGCKDARALLSSNLSYSDLQQARGGSPVVDLGTVDPKLIASCKANYAILSYYDEYLRDARYFPNEVNTYNLLLAGGKTVAIFSPEPGRVGGPIVRIVALPQQRNTGIVQPQ